MSRISTISPLLACAAFAFRATGCRIVPSAAAVPAPAVRAVSPGGKDKPAADPVEGQQLLMRFSEEFLARMVYGLDELSRGTHQPEPGEVLDWKIAVGTGTRSIASGANAVGNPLDATIFVTVTRKAFEDYRRPKAFGKSAQPRRDGCRSADTNIGLLTSQVLTPGQESDLRQSIEIWYQQNSLPGRMLAARPVGFASQVSAANPAAKTGSGSVFSLLGINPR